MEPSLILLSTPVLFTKGKPHSDSQSSQCPGVRCSRRRIRRGSTRWGCGQSIGNYTAGRTRSLSLKKTMGLFHLGHKWPRSFWSQDQQAEQMTGWPDLINSGQRSNLVPRRHHKLWGSFFACGRSYFISCLFLSVDIRYSFSAPGVKVLKSLTDLALVPPWTPARNVSTCFVTRF